MTVYKIFPRYRVQSTVINHILLWTLQVMGFHRVWVPKEVIIVVLPQFSSVQFSDFFFEPRTELSVQFRHLIELWTEPSVQVQRGSVQVQGGFEPRTEYKFT
ncbi:hypothetical protein L208DRAFT_575228 [Tricholoma matsutake]|nr:hypothetical protein L208DRAFT_575228 [Tricholoma matsutake 945]